MANEPTAWRTATKSAGGNCVEVRVSAVGSIQLRNSHYPHHSLHFTVDEFEAFIDGAKRGEFDDLIHIVKETPADA